jgi:quercetin dioxygenase-like cupin family protein
MRFLIPLLCAGFLAAQETPIQAVTADTPIDNAWVKVRRLTVKPGQEIPMHPHPDHVLISLNGASYDEAVEGGKAGRQTLKAGEAKYFPAMRHSVKSLSKEDMKLVLIEFKPGAPASTGQDATGTKDDPKQAKEEYSNDRVRVIRWRIGPKGASQHGHGNHVAVFLTAGRHSIRPETGPAKEASVQAGDIRWVEAQKHTIENLGTEAVEAVTVELRPKGK